MKGKKSHLSHVLLILVATIWGSGFVATQFAIDAGLSAAAIMFVRFSLSAAIMGVLFFRDLRQQLCRQHLSSGILLGVFLFLGFYLQTAGLRYSTPSNSAFLTAANVVMVPFIWWFISKKRPSLRLFIAAAGCLLGIATLSLRFDQALFFGKGDLLTLLCALFFACQIVWTQKLAKKIPVLVIVFLQFTTAALLSAFAYIFDDRTMSAANFISAWPALLYLAVFSTCLCFFIQTTAQKRVSPSKTAIILSSESLFGTLFSLLFGYDQLSWNMVLGGGLIIASVLLAEAKWMKRNICVTARSRIS